MAIPGPDVCEAKRILAIQPHYDDNEIGAGGARSVHDDHFVENAFIGGTEGHGRFDLYYTRIRGFFSQETIQLGIPLRNPAFHHHQVNAVRVGPR